MDVERLLAPIAETSPAGRNIRYLPLFSEIVSARREAAFDPSDPKRWQALVRLTSDALERESKDLQLAVWLLEALAHVEGFDGAAAGLATIRRLLEGYWEALYPAIDPEDDDPLGFRVSLMEWVDEQIPLSLKQVPLTGPPAGYGLLHREVSERTGAEKVALQEEGWPTRLQVDEALQSTPLSFLKQTLAGISACRKELAELQRVSDTCLVERHGPTEREGQVARPLVSFRRIDAVFQACLAVVEPAIAAKHPEQQAGEAPAAVEAGAGGKTDAAAPSVADPGGPDAVWGQANAYTRDGKLEGLRLIQEQILAARSGRQRFLRRIQLAELCLEAGIFMLAFPIYDELARAIAEQKLAQWEDPAVLRRVWTGLLQCCDRLKAVTPELEARSQELAERLRGP